MSPRGTGAATTHSAPEQGDRGLGVAWAVQQGLTVDVALRMPFYHPVLEGLRTALQGVKDDLEKAG